MKILSFLIAALLLTGLPTRARTIKIYTYNSGKPKVPVKVAGVMLSKVADTLAVIDTLQLTVATQPENASNKNVTWKSSNELVAKVSSGKVTPVANGSAMIIATAEDGGKADTCTVTVRFLGKVSFFTNQTWTVQGTGANASIIQTWSDVVVATGCNKETFDGGTSGNYKADCCSNLPYEGNAFSWEMVNQYAVQLCPSPWRIPTKDDFINLDKALGGTGANRTSNLAILDKYMGSDSDWGGRYTGINQGLHAYYWSATKVSTGPASAYNLYLYAYCGDIYPQDNRLPLSGFALRCVK